VLDFCHGISVVLFAGSLGEGTIVNFLSPLILNRITHFQTIDTVSLSCPPYSLRVCEITLTIKASDVNDRRVIREGRSSGGEILTVSTSRVPTSVIEQARRAIRSTPECVAKDVAKGEAIRALIPDILGMHSKGYDWSAIAELLTQQGIAVTGVTLKSHLQQAKTAKRRKARGGRDAAASKRSSATKGSREQKLPATRSVAGGPNRAADNAAPAPAMGAGKHAPGEAPKTGRAAQDAAIRRSAFVPEEDTDDL
jgi:hypothetical protein